MRWIWLLIQDFEHIWWCECRRIRLLPKMAMRLKVKTNIFWCLLRLRMPNFHHLLEVFVQGVASYLWSVLLKQEDRHHSFVVIYLNGSLLSLQDWYLTQIWGVLYFFIGVLNLFKTFFLLISLFDAGGMLLYLLEHLEDHINWRAVIGRQVRASVIYVVALHGTFLCCFN